MKNFTINQAMIRNVVGKFSPFLVYIPFIAVIAIFLGSIFFIISSQLVYLLFTALALFLVAKLLKYPLSYAKSYQLDLHLATIFTLMFIVFDFAKLNLQFPFLRLILYT